MLKNKKPLIGIIVLNYIAKIVCLISMMFFIVQAIDNTQNISSIFNENYSNWEALDGYGIVPVSKIPIEAFNSPDYPKIQQKIYKEFNAKGGILAHFNEFSPAVRSDRLKASNFYYERDNVVVNPNYLNKYKLYDSNNNEIVISENDVDQIILVADKYKDDEKNILKVANSYKEQEFFSTGENQKTKIIWTKSNQKVFTAAVDINPDSGNCIVDPIIYVLTENNGTTSDYDCLLGKMGNPFKIKADKNKTPEVTIREMFAKYGIEDYIGTITSVNEQISTSINNVKDNIKNAIIFTSLLMIILIITIIQNVINYIDKYKQKLAIEKLIGYTILDKHKIYLIGTIVCWNIVFSLSILLYKTAIIKIAIVSMIGFIIEIIFSLIILNVIEKRKIIGILKGE